MPVQCKTVLYPVKDLDKAKALFAALFGAEPHAMPRTTSASRSTVTRSGSSPVVMTRA